MSDYIKQEIVKIKKLCEIEHVPVDSQMIVDFDTGELKRFYGSVVTEDDIDNMEDERCLGIY